MEDLNKSIKQALSFLHIVQNSISDYRELLDGAYKKEYYTFVEKWKKYNKQMKQEQNNKQNADFKDEVKIVIPQPVNMVELDHADQLLEKARKIRKQLKKSSEKHSESSQQVMHSKKNFRTVTKKAAVHEGLNVESASTSIKDDSCDKRMSRLKASAPSQELFINSVPPPKNMRVNVVQSRRQPKGHTVVHKPTDRKASGAFGKNKTLSKPHIAVVSREKFLSLKTLHIADVSPTKRKATSEVDHILSVKNIQVQPSEVILNQKQLPTYKEFHKMLDVRSKQQPFKLNQKWAWYTFLNSKSEMHLSRVICCKNYEDMKKVLLLLGRIQETMFWLDFFNVVGKEICPRLQNLDKNQKCTRMIIQCLQNIFSKGCGSPVMTVLQ